MVQQFLDEVKSSAPRASERRMSENGSDSLPFEAPEQENIRLREENARLRRLLAVHSIPIPQARARESTSN